MSDNQPKCEICNGESPGSKYVGVASVPGFPYSCAWCQNCLQEGCTVLFIADMVLDQNPLQDVAAWFKEEMVWYNGKYMSVEKYASERLADPTRVNPCPCGCLDVARQPVPASETQATDETQAHTP